MRISHIALDTARVIYPSQQRNSIVAKCGPFERLVQHLCPGGQSIVGRIFSSMCKMMQDTGEPPGRAARTRWQAPRQEDLIYTAKVYHSLLGDERPLKLAPTSFVKIPDLVANEIVRQE